MAFKLTMKANLLICLVMVIISLMFHMYLLEIYLNFWVNLPLFMGADIYVGIPVVLGIIVAMKL